MKFNRILNILGKRKIFSNNSNEEDECQKMSPFLLLETRRVGTRKIPLNKNLKGNIRRTNTFDKCSSTEYKDQIFHNFFHHFLLLNGFKCRTM